MGTLRLGYTRHAIHVDERKILVEWVERVVDAPALRTPDTPDTNDPEVERFFRRIPEHGDRVLRVAVNTRVAPWRVYSSIAL